MGTVSPIPTYIINIFFAHFKINKNLGRLSPIPTYIINIFFAHFKYTKTDLYYQYSFFTFLYTHDIEKGHS